MTFHLFLTSDGLTWCYRGDRAAETTVKEEKDQEITGGLGALTHVLMVVMWHVMLYWFKRSTGFSHTWVKKIQ